MALMLFGAYSLAYYLRFKQPSLVAELREMESGIWFAYWICIALGGLLDPRDINGNAGLRPPSPRLSGVLVVVLTGVAASVAVAQINPIYGLLVAAGTIILAVAVWGFATAHASDIGEARFTTDVAGS